MRQPNLSRRARRDDCGRAGANAAGPFPFTSSVQPTPWESLEPRQLFSALPEAYTDLPFEPGRVVADPTRDVAYVADLSSNRIVAIDTDTGRSTAVATLSAAPDGFTVSTDGRQLFVAEPAADRIEYFNLPSLAKQGSYNLAPIGLSPHAIAFAGGDKLFVSVPKSGRQTIEEIDLTTGTDVGSIVGGTNLGVSASADGLRVYAWDVGGSTVDRFDATSAGAATLLDTNPIQFPVTDLAVAGSKQEAYVATTLSNGAALLDFPTRNVSVLGGLAIGSLVAVAAPDDGTSVFGAGPGPAGTDFVEQISAPPDATTLQTYPIPGGNSYHIDPGSLKVTPNDHLIYTATDADGGTRRLYLIGASAIDFGATTGGSGGTGGGSSSGGTSGGSSGGSGSGTTSHDGVALSVTGTVFNDRNADGLRARRDYGAGGWTVYLDTNGNGALDSGEPTAVSASNGNYHLVVLQSQAAPFRVGASYAVRAVPRAGFRATTDAAAPPITVRRFGGSGIAGPSIGETAQAQVTGVVYLDANANGRLDAAEVGLSGVSVFLDFNDDGKYDAGDILTATDRRGRYVFNVSAPGTYTVRVIRPKRRRFTSPVSGAVSVTVANAGGLGVAPSVGMR